MQGQNLIKNVLDRFKKVKNSKERQMEGETQEQFDENILESIERNAGSALDQAQAYIDDFQKSRVEVLPAITGSLYAQGSLKKKQFLRFFKIQADQGIILKFASEQDCLNNDQDLASLDKKTLQKQVRQQSLAFP